MRSYLCPQMRENVVHTVNLFRLNRTVGTNAKCQTLFFRFGIPAIFPSHGRDKRQTPNTEYTIINAVNKILIVLGQICVL